MTAEAAVLTCWHRRLFYGIIDPQTGRFEENREFTPVHLMFFKKILLHLQPRYE